MNQHEVQVFDTGLDETSAAHLLETTRWTKFLAIIGFLISAGMFFIALLYFYANGSGATAEVRRIVLTGTIYGILVAGVYVYPAYALFKFSTSIKKGIQNKDQTLLNAGFRYQKHMYRYLGIVTIIALVLMLLGFMIMELKAL